MEILIIGCVIAVFSFWIWSLKQEIAELRGRGHSEQEEVAPETPSFSHVARQRTADHVQTWTID